MTVRNAKTGERQGTLLSLLPGGTAASLAEKLERRAHGAHASLDVGNPAAAKILLRAIRRKCLECSGGQRDEVARCDLSSCPLHPFKDGGDWGLDVVDAAH